MINYLAVFIGGGLGAVFRLFVSSQAVKHLGSGFPWGTLAVNLIGAVLIALVIELGALKFQISEQLKYLLVTGFLGGFTTFSAFSLETASMWMRGDIAPAILYAAISVIGTVGLVLLTTYAVRSVF
jgi:CrcB protein